MRPASALVAALALAACQVNVEGAPCTTPGTAADCPDGQACGHDSRCSNRAASCLDACAQAGLLCAIADASYTCTKCPANATTEFAADPAGSAPSAPLAPTGVSQPVQCRFNRLGDALAAATALGGPTTVKVFGAAGSPVVFTNETFPLVVPPDVTVAGADAPAETIIQGNAGTSAAMVALQGVLQGVQVANVSMTGDGVDMTCGATGAPTLRDVIVSSGTPKLASGVTIAGSCGALLERVDVSGASGPALAVTASAASTPVTVTGGKFHASGTGIQATGGTLVVQPDATAGATEVTDNTGTGIQLTGATPVVDATLSGVLVARNGGTGIFVDNVAQTSKLRMTACNVQLNGTVAPTQYGPPGGQRPAGGMLLSQTLLGTFQLQGNSFHANYGAGGADELAFESSGAWTLSTGSCGSPAPNAFGCLKGGSYAVSVWPGTVDARFTIWPSIPPGSSVSAGVTVDSGCAAWSGTCPP